MALLSLAGFELSLFQGDVDEYFLCQVCHKVAKDPIECSICENILCAYCSNMVSQCPTGCQDFQTRETSKFAYMIYSRLYLKCRNFQNGCEFEGEIYDIIEHDFNCKYETLICGNPICRKQYIRHMGYPESAACSSLCKDVNEFQQVLHLGDKLAILEYFKNQMGLAKEKLAKEVTNKFQDQLKRLDNYEQQIKINEKEIAKLEEELNMRKQMYHPGKWNRFMKNWTCCSSHEQKSIGCKELI